MDPNLRELFNWIDDHFIRRQKRNLNRDFSDAVPLVEILKVYYPKLVDLHNYGPKHAVLKKIENWYTLNRKVLCKLDLQLNHEQIENIAKCVPGAVEELLFKVKVKTEALKKTKDVGNNEGSDSVADGDIRVTDSNKDKPKMVPVVLLEQKIMELDIKDQAVVILNQKINHMQTLLDIKDQRIGELEQKLDEHLAKEKSGGGFFEKFMR